MEAWASMPAMAAAPRPIAACGRGRRRLLRAAAAAQRSGGGGEAGAAGKGAAASPGRGGLDPAALFESEAGAAAVLCTSLALGVLLGAAGVGLDDSLPAAAQGPSAALGWSYFLCWSVSFYPQILENQRSRDASGLSPDYLLFSLLGYICYAAYTGALFLSDDVRASYAGLHGSAPDVSAADFAFAFHALGATLVTAAQYAAFRPPGAPAGPSPLALGVGAAVAAACAGSAAHIGATCDAADCASWMPMLVLLGGVKVTMTLVKYTPQVVHNHQRRSTQGWSLSNVLLDLSGGVLSLGQVVLDAAARHDLTVITGSPAKMWVAGLSIAYDLIFMAQHYWLYQDKGGAGDRDGAAGEAARSVAAQQRAAQGQGPQAQAQLVPVAVASAAEVRREQLRRAAVRVFALGGALRGGAGAGAPGKK